MTKPTKESYIEAVAALLNDVDIKTVKRIYNVTQLIWRKTINKGA